MVRIRLRFSLRLFLLAVSAGCVTLGVSKMLYDLDRNRVEVLSPSCKIYPSGIGVAFLRGNRNSTFFGGRKYDVVATACWIGPVWLRQCMRYLGMPWLDRINRVYIRDDEHVTIEKLLTLSDSSHLKTITIYTQDESKYRPLVDAISQGIEIELRND